MSYLFKVAEPARLSPAEQKWLADMSFDLNALPSMRLVWSGGAAAEANNVAIYNCAFHGITDFFSFSETLYILMSGTGCGVSVEEKFISQIDPVKKQTGTKVYTHTISDSREGWSDALGQGVYVWLNGEDIDFDFSAVRPAGARLHKMGGRSSGPEPLRQLLEFTRKIILSRAGQRLRSIDVADIVNMIGVCTQMGGVRRSSEIILFTYGDEDMLHAKDDGFWEYAPWRTLGNNSVVWEGTVLRNDFDEMWKTLQSTGTGEPGIFIRDNSLNQAPRRAPYPHFGTNPCGEIVLRSRQFCNLSEVVCREDDTVMTLAEKVKAATIFGTIQSSVTDFTYIRPEWKRNCDEERLLGVSLTGVADCPLTNNENVLEVIRNVAVIENAKMAERLGINPSHAITCNKPSGTAGKLVSASNGVGDRWAHHQITRVRIDAHDPLLQLLRASGVDVKPENGQNEANATTYVTSWPVKSPDSATTRHSHTALQQCERWLRLKLYWCEHNPSTTIYVRPEEWAEVGEWVWKNWKLIGGLAFFPASDNAYEQAPQEEITSAAYEDMMSRFPSIDYSLLPVYETEDMTTGETTYACVGNSCDL